MGNILLLRERKTFTKLDLKLLPKCKGKIDGHHLRVLLRLKNSTGSEIPGYVIHMLV